MYPVVASGSKGCVYKTLPGSLCQAIYVMLPQVMQNYFCAQSLAHCKVNHCFLQCSTQLTEWNELLPTAVPLNFFLLTPLPNCFPNLQLLQWLFFEKQAALTCYNSFERFSLCFVPLKDSPSGFLKPNKNNYQPMVTATLTLNLQTLLLLQILCPSTLNQTYLTPHSAKKSEYCLPFIMIWQPSAILDPTPVIFSPLFLLRCFSNSSWW